MGLDGLKFWKKADEKSEMTKGEVVAVAALSGLVGAGASVVGAEAVKDFSPAAPSAVPAYEQHLDRAGVQELQGKGAGGATVTINHETGQATMNLNEQQVPIDPK